MRESFLHPVVGVGVPLHRPCRKSITQKSGPTPCPAPASAAGRGKRISSTPRQIGLVVDESAQLGPRVLMALAEPGHFPCCSTAGRSRSALDAHLHRKQAVGELALAHSRRPDTQTGKLVSWPRSWRC